MPSKADAPVSAFIVGVLHPDGFVKLHIQGTTAHQKLLGSAIADVIGIENCGEEIVLFKGSPT